jgi:hypothetical protein
MDDFDPRGVNWKNTLEYIDMTMFVSADVEVEVSSTPSETHGMPET